MGNNDRLQQLISKYLNKSLSAMEEAELLNYFEDPSYLVEIEERLGNEFDQELGADELNETQERHILLNIFRYNKDLVKTTKTRKLWPRIGIAAAVAAILISAAIWFTHKPYVNDIAPGSAGATLTLANGKKIRLSDAVNGELAREAGIKITKSADGQIVYEIASSPRNDEPNPSETYNTLSTAKGETYQLRLPDGSLVYLNAASSLTYNAALIEQGKRVVKLEGEGYFEIAKDKSHPFIVKTDQQEVEVLGTHFNINSYRDNGVEKTTLLEGSVKLTAFDNYKILKPGQQAKLDENKLNVYEVDTDLAVAWKNNEFTFESESIETVMKMVERWYNVEVVYVGEKTTEKFSGAVSRFDNVSKVLQIVESTGTAHFKIEGRKIYVSR